LYSSKLKPKNKNQRDSLKMHYKANHHQPPTTTTKYKSSNTFNA